MLHSENGAFREPAVNRVLPSRIDEAELKERDEFLLPQQHDPVCVSHTVISIANKNDVSILGINKNLITDQRDQQRAPLVHCAAVVASLASLPHAHLARLHRRRSLTKHRG